MIVNNNNNFCYEARIHIIFFAFSFFQKYFLPTFIFHYSLFLFLFDNLLTYYFILNKQIITMRKSYITSSLQNIFIVSILQGISWSAFI